MIIDDKTNIRDWRNSEQYLRPVENQSTADGNYELYPAFPVGEGKIDTGFKSIADKIKHASEVVVDGYVGVLWDNFKTKLNKELEAVGKKAAWINVADAMLSTHEVQELVEPFLGGDDPIFGTRFTGELAEFFDEKKLKSLTPDENAGSDITILYGCGAALAGWNAPMIYLDLPKNELQFRSRAGSVRNLGADEADNPKKMYKRFYFVDWIVLNKHKAEILQQIDWIVDEQRPDEPSIFSGDNFRYALHEMSKNSFRARPWFEPGTWGGQWIKEKIPALPQDLVNYAWSFELITPENGLMFSSDNKLLEVSFDWLMFQEYDAVLGECAKTFKYEFPIRFDFLDTFDGGNLSVQCHPKPSFIRKEFGETFTQDETYYMLDCKPGALVYLGFQDDINPEEFRKALEQSVEKNEPIEVEKYVQTFEANKHDLFLIPHETIHCSGTDNMVLEISATPYIFTFKMYDWLRLDLNGKPRPINIERGFENLNFTRKGKKVEEELISKPTIISEGEGWKLVHLPTHQNHFYDIQRFEFEDAVEAKTNGSCHVLSLVEGSKVRVETETGGSEVYNYAETFIVPASVKSYRLINESNEPIKVVTAFVKDDYEKIMQEAG